MLTGEQIRAARSLLRMEQKELAKSSEVSLPTIKRLEAINGNVNAYGTTLEKIRDALETAGVSFVDPNGMGPGVRLRESGE